MKVYSGVKVDQLLEKSLEILARNHRLISNNIANVNTPGFRASHINFKETLAQSLRKEAGKSALNSRQVGKTKEHVVMEKSFTDLRNDEGQVDLDFETTALIKNTSDYTLYARLLAKRFDQLKNMLRNAR